MSVTRTIRRAVHRIATSKRGTAFAVGVFVGLVTTAIAFLAFARMGAPARRDALHYTNLFKVLVGTFYIAFALYAFYGPAINRLGYARRLTPAGKIPASVSLVYFAAGSFIVLAGLRVFDPGRPVVLFWRLVAFAGLWSLAVGYGVFVVERANEHGDSGGV